MQLFSLMDHRFMVRGLARLLVFSRVCGLYWLQYLESAGDGVDDQDHPQHKDE